jgi:hypothetical protein
MNLIGLGNKQAYLKVYIENRPPLAEYQCLQEVRPLISEEIANVVQQAGNHWRKIFNVYAKLIFAIEPIGFSTWQQLRDSHLLQDNSEQCLLFSPPIFNSVRDIHIVMGRTYASKLALSDDCYWLTPEFAINEHKQLIICPYFDYRQLSNRKIAQLVQLIRPLLP